MDGLDILLIADADAGTALSEDLCIRIKRSARAKGLAMESVAVHRDESPACTGCMACLTRTPGRCVRSGAFSAIGERAAGCRTVIFLSPAPFGTFSPTIKNIIDRGGNLIRDNAHCRQIVIGYGADATDEERSTFIDITARHRGAADIVHLLVREDFSVFFTRSLDDNERICGSLGGPA